MSSTARRFAFLALMLCVLPGSAALALSPPIDHVLRRGIMLSELAIVGRVVATEPFSKYEWDRTSLVVVDAVVFGAAGAGDTLKVAWRADRRENPDGGYSVVACGGGSQLSELEGQRLLWFMSGGSPAGLRLPPVDVSGMAEDRAIELAAIADGTRLPSSGIPLLFKDSELLESDPENHTKCELVSRYLRGIAEPEPTTK